MGNSLRSLQLIGYEALVRVRPTVYSLAAEDSAVIAFIVILFVNPRPDEGGPKGPPCWFFANNSNSVGNSALKFSVPLRASILRIL